MESSIPKAEPPKAVAGYKVFESDWTCRGKQYSCPGIFEEDGKPEICKHGMHFCKELVDCFDYYDFTEDHHYAEVIAHGDVITEGDKSCTNKLEIVREIPFEEVMRRTNIAECNSGINNTGSYNYGSLNSGSYNDGDDNSGDCNSGVHNSGDFNIGDYNSGLCNAGDYNSGDYNVGHYNSGDCNVGDHNAGNWNLGDYHVGFFNVQPEPIMMFDKPVDRDVFMKWRERDYYTVMDIMCCCSMHVSDEYINMTCEEKDEHPVAKITRTYLQFRSDVVALRQKWWDTLDDWEKGVVTSMPNFDPEIFEKCTGIKVRSVPEAGGDEECS